MTIIIRISGTIANQRQRSEMSELQRERIGAAAEEAIELHAAAEAGDPMAITRGALGNNAVRVHFKWGKLLMRDLLSRSPPS